MIVSQLVLLTLEDYLVAMDLFPALIFIFMAGLFGFLPSSHSLAATKVSWENKECVFVSISFILQVDTILLSLVSSYKLSLLCLH